MLEESLEIDVWAVVPAGGVFDDRYQTVISILSSKLKEKTISEYIPGPWRLASGGWSTAIPKLNKHHQRLNDLLISLNPRICYSLMNLMVLVYFLQDYLCRK